MELTMTNNFGFCELNENEMMLVDGGDGWRVVGYVCTIPLAIGAVVCTGGIAAAAAAAGAVWYAYDALTH